MVVFLLKLIVVAALALLAFCVWRTWQLEHSPEQARFLVGTVPDPRPDGLYAGTVLGHKVSWLGKKFDSANQTGINVFDAGSGATREQYPFATSVGTGLRDTALQVLRIDYNIPENPFWLKPILDEVVEVSPSHYLGKLQLRIIPGYPFTLAYFELQKE